MPKVNLTPYSGKPTKEEKIAAKMAYYMKLEKVSAKDMCCDGSFRKRLQKQAERNTGDIQA